MTPQKTETHIIAYEPNDAALAKLKTDFSHILADPKGTVATTKGYSDAKIALQLTRNMRGILEKKRVELKADALEYGRKVDSKAKEVLAKIMEIEEPIKAAKDEFDAADEKKKQDAIDAIKAKAEAEEKAKRDAEEAIRKATYEAEQAKLKAERDAFEAEKKAQAEAKAVEDAKRKAEDDARRAEQAKADAEARAERDRIAAEQKAESDRLAAEQKKIDDEKARLAKIETDRLAKEKAEQEAKDRAEFERKTREEAEAKAKAKAEADRITAEKAAKEKADAEKAEAARIAAAAPDQAKIRGFGEELDQWTTSHAFQLKTDSAKAVIADAYERLNALSVELCNYSTPKKSK